MRVGLLVYGLDRPLSGISRYTVELARAMVRLEDGPDLTLLAAGGCGPLAHTGFRSQSLKGCRRLPGLVSLGNLLLPRAANRLDLDLVHDPTGVAPFALGANGAKIVATVCDVLPLSYPGTSTLLDTLIYRYWLPRVLPGADRVITISEHSRRDIGRYLGIPSSVLRPVPLGVAPRFQPVSPEQVASHLVRRFGLRPPYVLYVGAITIRKNVVRALRAFASIRQFLPELRFVLAGARVWRKTPLEPVIQELGLADRVYCTGPFPDADLPALYAGADLFVFPSLYEGFGLPPLEAMACGTPVVCSNAASLPEVVGDAALTVDPYDVDALADAMCRVLVDGQLREDLRARGLARARRFSWEKTARETVAVYREVLGHTAREGGDVAQQE